MKGKEVTKNKIPIAIIDPQLEEERDKIYFSEKLKQANEMLKTARLPKLKYAKRSST